MEFKFLAQQQLELFININLALFTVSLIIFFVAIYLASREKKDISRTVLYLSMIISALTFTSAVSISSYNPYDTLFTQEVLRFIQISNYCIWVVVCLLVVSSFMLARKRAPRQ
jgi:hypothetical protein